MSKWFNRSSHRVRRTLSCFFFYSVSVLVPKLGDRKVAGLVFRIGGILNVRGPRLRPSSSNSLIEYFFSASFGSRLAKAISFKSPFICFCHSAIPRPVSLASVVTMFSSMALKCVNHSCVVSSLLRLLKYVLRSSVHSQFVPFFNSYLILSVFLDRFGINFVNYCTAPRKAFSVFYLLVLLGYLIASVFSSFGLIPS